LARAVEERKRRASTSPEDILDVVVQAAPDHPAAELAEVFLSFLFALVGSVGFTLGWSVYLLGMTSRRPPRDSVRPQWIVREALRLWPIAWMLARRPAKPHSLLGVSVGPEDQVVACPYLVHRNPRYWAEPGEFRPERWRAMSTCDAFMPFGVGPHGCVAGSLSLTLVADVLTILLERYTFTVSTRDHRPHVGPALAPPRFTLKLQKV
jgi:cytochrome P450